jgi:hypothetical protein
VRGEKGRRGRRLFDRINRIYRMGKEESILTPKT